MLSLILSLGLAFEPSDILADYQWRKRLLLIFAPSVEDASYQQQCKALANYPAEFEDRDLLIFHVFAVAGSGPEGELAVEMVQALRQQYAIEAPFTLILVGKDGGIKRRESQPVGAEELFSQIDSMSMRQREMRTQPED